MATNKSPFVKNLITGETQPLLMLGYFQAGSTQAIKRGELLEKTGATNTAWVPMDSDFAGASNVAVAWEEIKAGDRAGYYWICVPRPGDVFEFALDTANNPAAGTAVYWSDSQTVSESGSNQLGTVAGQDHYPARQGHLADDASGDMGTTIRNTSFVQMTIKAAASYYAALQA